MPPETAPHERTLISWPCRRELWGSALDDAKREYAGVANAVADFEPVTIVASTAADRTEAGRAAGADVEVIEIPLDDSWVRDNGPTFVVGGPEGRLGVHFGFNAWGAKFDGWDRDLAAGASLAGRFATEVVEAPLVLEGGDLSKFDLMSPFVWEQPDGGFAIMVRAVIKNRTPTDDTGTIYYGVSTDGVTFTVYSGFL